MSLDVVVDSCFMVKVIETAMREKVKVPKVAKVSNRQTDERER